MTDKITLTNLVNLQNETTAVNAIKANNAAITTAFDNTLSRDGTNPNTMGAALDMNSNRIINLPQALSADEPVRKTEFDAAVFGTLIPTLGTTTVFETRAAVATTAIPSTVTSIIVKSYGTGYPAEPAVYVKGVSGSNPLAVTDLNGATWGVTTKEVYPEYFGAKRDGTTDDAPAIQAAMSYLATAIPSVLRLRSGTYLLASETNQAYVTLYTGVSITGEGNSSILKITSNTAFGWIALGCKTSTNTDRVDAVEYRNFTLDGNGVNNQSANYMAGFLIAYGKDISFDGVTIQNFPGSQPLEMGLNAGLIGQPTSPTIDNIRITNCKFYDVGQAINALNTDWSAIYVVANSALIANNEIRQTNQTNVGTGIEMHGNGLCVGNTIYRANQGFIVGAYPDSDFIVVGNKVREAYVFASVWDTIGGGQAVFNTKAVFANNYGSAVNSTGAPFIDLTSFTTGTGNTHVKIAGNFFESLEATGSSSIEPVILYGKVKHVEVIGNTAKNFSGQFFQQGAEFLVNAQGLRISENTIIDCCTNASTPKTAIQIASNNAMIYLQVNNNVISNTSTIYMTTGISGNSPMATSPAGTAKFIYNTFYNVTTPYNWTGSGSVVTV